MSQFDRLPSSTATFDRGMLSHVGGRLARVAAGSPLILTSLSLNLILLAFFVVLNGTSQFDDQRVAAVLDGVKSKFGLVTPFAESGQVAGETRAVARDALRDSISAAFETVLSGRELVLVTRANRIDVRVPTAVLFEGENGAMRASIPLLGRLATVLTQPADGLRYELIISANLAGNRVSVSSAIGHVVEGLIARGVPPVLMSAGTSTIPEPVTGALGEFLFSFLVLDVSDPLPVAALAGDGRQ